MIKVYNQKSLNDIEELREKGLYNAPFSVHEAANPTATQDTKELKEKVTELENEVNGLKEKLEESEKTVANYVIKTEGQAKTIDELNADLDALVGGSDE